MKFSKIVSNSGKLQAHNVTIISKSTVDYYGVYKGRFIAFEAKSTDGNSLSKFNIKEHQIKYLETIEKNDGIAFFVVFFKTHNKFFALKASQVKKTLNIKEANTIGYELDFIFPGRLDIVKYIKDITSK